MRQVVNQPTRCPHNPVLKGENPWETTASLYGTVIYDEREGIFKIWYFANPAWPGHTDRKFHIRGLKVHGISLLAYAYSKDGICWEKPKLNQLEFEGSKKNNLIDIGRYNSEGVGIIYQPEELDPQRRYKAIYWEHGAAGIQQREDGLVLWSAGKGDGIWVSFSSDGINWKNYPKNPILPKHSDTHHPVVYDSAIGKYVCYGRMGTGRRVIARSESPDFINWSQPELVFEPDAEDNPPYVQFYGMPVDLYEGLYLGMLWVYWEGRDGTIDTQLAVSRDGRNWQRVGNKQTFLSLGETGSWEDGMVRVCGNYIVKGDIIYLFYNGVNGSHVGPKFKTVERKFPGMIGLATLRRDGFVSLDAGEKEGTILTKPFTLPSDKLHLNVDAHAGQVRASLCDLSGRFIAVFEGSHSVTGDHLDTQIIWPDKDLKDLVSKRLRLRFFIRNAKLYSYWFT